MANGNQLPEGFVLDNAPPAGFVIDQPGVQPEQTALQKLDQAILSIPGMPAIAEFAAGANRSIADIIDFFGADTINAALQISGSDARVPTLGEKLAVPRGQFEQGLPGDVAATAGELAPAAAAIGAGLRGVVSRLGPQKIIEATAKGVTRQLAKTTPGQDIGAAVASGAGQEIGRAVGGETGALIGGFLTPISGAMVGQKLVSRAGTSPSALSYLDDRLAAPVQAANESSLPPAITPPTFKDTAKKAVIRKAINEGTVDAVGFKVNEAGRVVKDQLQRNLVNNNVNEKAVVAMANLSPGDRVQAKKMVRLASDFIRGVKGSERNRPQKIIGESAMKRFELIAKHQKQASKDIGKAVEKDLKGKSADTTDLVDEFEDALSALNIKIDGGKLDFKESLVRGSNLTPIKNVYSSLKTSYDDAAELHKMKQFISNQINFEAPALKPLDSQAEKALKALRAGINQRLRDMSDDYAKANDAFSRDAQVLQPFAKAMGRKFDPESARVEDFVGQELRKTITNYNKSNELIVAIDDLDLLAKELGGDFTDDLMTQVMLNSELERLFGSFAPGSLQGVQEKVADLAIDRAFGTAGQVVKTGVEQAGKRILFKPPSKEKLKLLDDISKLIEGGK